MTVVFCNVVISLETNLSQQAPISSSDHTSDFTTQVMQQEIPIVKSSWTKKSKKVSLNETSSSDVSVVASPTNIEDDMRSLSFSGKYHNPVESGHTILSKEEAFLKIHGINH